MRKRIAVGLVFAGVALTAMLGSHILVAKEPSKADVPKTLCDSIMAKLKADDLPGFFTLLETDPAAPAQKPNEVVKQTVKAQRDEFARINGKSIGEVELVRTETIGKSLVRLTYLDKFERAAMMWQFVFYRTGDDWKITGLNWNGNAMGLFSEVR